MIALPPAPLPVVVVDAAAAPKDRTTLGKAHAGALAAFASATGTTLGDLAPDAPTKVFPVGDPAERAARGLRVEAALRRARALLDDGDAATLGDSRAAAAVAYAEARAHPEDPECPMWLGEALRALARAEALSGGTSGAAALVHRARLLDGGRLLGLSEAKGLTLLEPGPKHTLTIALISAPEPARVYVDGERLAGNTASLEPGEHHLRVVTLRAGGLDGPVLDARLFTLGDADAVITLRVGSDPEPCSPRDVAPALLALAKDTGAAYTAMCPRWARVVARDDGTVAVQRCGPTHCAPATHWALPLIAAPPPLPPEGSSLLRSPWTWVAVGVGAAAAASLTAWGLGAFDAKAAPPPTWRWEPAR